MSNSLLTPEIVERAVKAARGAVYLQGGLKLSRKYADAFAIAALEAVIPSLIEECAKAAEGIPLFSRDEFGQGIDVGRDDAATAIRSLIPSKENK